MKNFLKITLVAVIAIAGFYIGGYIFVVKSVLDICAAIDLGTLSTILIGKCAIKIVAGVIICQNTLPVLVAIATVLL